MTVKYYCDYCGKETFHMDLQDVKGGKHICPKCMKVRCWDMAHTILNMNVDEKNADQIKYLYTTLAEVIVRLDLVDLLIKTAGGVE